MFVSTRSITAIVVGLLTGVSIWANDIDDRAKVVARFDPPRAKRGQVVTWIMQVELKTGFHTYPTRQVGNHPDIETLVSTVRKPRFGELVPVGDVIDPEAVPVKHEGHEVLWVEGVGEWKMQFVIHPQATPGKKQFRFRGTLPICDDKNCLASELPAAELVIEAEAVEVPEEHRAVVAKFPVQDPTKAKPPDSPVAPSNSTNGSGNPSTTPAPFQPSATRPSEPRPEIAAPAATLEEARAGLETVGRQLEFVPGASATNASGGLGGFLLAAVFWGAVALVTPCVFPMIPITVSFFLHQSEKEHHRPIRMALIYCGTIILVLGISALTLLTTFRALSVDPLMNIGLGALFIFFALSLFGLYEIRLPTRLTQFTAAREGRGGVVGTVFMALTFTIVSFTCVAPFLGGFGGMASSGQLRTWELVLGALAFSTTFAAPFFVLALFPTLLRKLPQSGSWLNSVKVVMGFLELAAALKFFRTAELRLLELPTYFTYDLVLGIWVALALIVGAYLLNLFRLHHDEPMEHIGVGRLLLGAAFVSLGLYLMPALFKTSGGLNQRPRGAVYAWVDAFLLPEAAEEDLPFSINLKGTIDQARVELERTGKRQFVFVDFTGVTCTNCKYNERTVFSRPDVREQLQEFRLVQLYTDTVPAHFYPFAVDDDRRDDEAKQVNLVFQRQHFGTEQLPLYVVLEIFPNKVRVNSIYDEGKINDPVAFNRFLRNARK
jgi:thiol:disulfide interchange protein DsbD